MLPDNNAVSHFPVIDSFILPIRTSFLEDYEYGGTNIYEATQSFSTLWKCFYEDGQIKLSNDQVNHELLTVADVQSLSLAFDLNMRPMIAYSTTSSSFLYWYDTSVAAQTTTELGGTYSFMQLSLDDNRSSQTANADVILAYIKNNKLFMRIQRERFLIEHELTKAKQLKQIGMMRNNRFGFAHYDW